MSQRGFAVVRGSLLVWAGLFVPAAQAGTVGVDGNVARFASTTGEENRLTVSVVGGELRFADAQVMVAGNGCSSVAPNDVRCPIVGSMSLSIESGAGNDSVLNDTSLPSGIAGHNGDDVLTGGPGPDRIYGLGEDPDVDVIDGRGGNDFIDTQSRTPPDSPDRVRCGDGVDRVVADFHDHIESDCETVERAGEPLPGGGGLTDAQGNPIAPPTGPAGRTCAFNIIGTPLDDSLDGTAAGDRIYGVGGNDSLRGLGANDCLFGGAGRDELSGGAGSDRLDGGDGRDRLAGGRGHDTLRGRSGPDTLVGAGGNDRLVGGRGKNRLSSGSGRDWVLAANGVPEVIRCGRGRDVARVDGADRVIGCERVARRR